MSSTLGEKEKLEQVIQQASCKGAAIIHLQQIVSMLESDISVSIALIFQRNLDTLPIFPIYYPNIACFTFSVR